MSDRLQQEAMVTEERQQESSEKEESILRRSRNRKYRLTGLLPAKIIAFFLLAGSCLAGLLFTGFCIYIGINGYYTEGRNAAICSVNLRLWWIGGILRRPGDYVKIKILTFS